MVLFYANVIMQNQASKLSYFFCLIIGREERVVPDIAGGKVAPLSFVTSWERIFREFYLVLFPPGPRHSHLYAKRGAHWALCYAAASQSLANW